LQREIVKVRFELDNSLEDAENLATQNQTFIADRKQLMDENEEALDKISKLESQVRILIYI
jgi:hypothetical protein